jgi:hypothetical protein
MACDELIDLWNGAASGKQRTEFAILRALAAGYIAISPSDTPALIVPLSSGEFPRGRVLGSVRLRYESALRFDVAGKAWSQPAAVIDCLDVGLVRTFSAVIRDVLARLVDAPINAKAIATALAAWDELLRRRNKLTDASELGLWGELHLLGLAPNRDAMVAAWRGPLGDSADFLGGGIALECKTSSRRHQHTVSYRQSSFQGQHLESYLVSVWAPEDPTSGKTLGQVVDELLVEVTDEQALLRKLMAAGYREEHRPEYQRRYRCPSQPKFIGLEHVPRVQSFDEGITNIRYDVDLGRAPAVSGEAVRRLLGRMTGSESDE